MKMKVNTPTVYQMEATECGAASLAMILAYWKCYVPLEQLRIDTGVSRDGCNAWNILRGAKKYGLEAHGYRMEPKALMTKEMPCIIHWNFNHFVVLEGFRGKTVFINDPANGKRRLSMEEFDECFTGIVLTFKKTETFAPRKAERSIWSFIKERLHTRKTAMVALVILGLLFSIPGMIIPVATQLFMDQVMVSRNLSWAGTLITIIAVSALLQGFLYFYRSWIQLKLNLKVSLLSAHGFFYHLFRLPINFFDQRSAGDLVRRSENNDTVNQFLINDFSSALLNLLTALIYMLLLIRYNVVLFLIGLAGIALNIILTGISSGVIQNSTEKTQTDAAKLAGIVFSGISITETLKASGVENDFVSRVLGQQAKSASAEQRAGKIQTLLDAATEVVNQVFSILTLVAGGLLVIHGSMTAGMLVAFLSLLDSFTEPVQTLISFMKKVYTLRADMNRVDDVLQYRADSMAAVSEAKALPMQKLTGQISVSDISFGYSELENPLIEHVSLELQPGQSVAFVGASGSGKSTIGKMLSGLYHPWQGEILFDGIRIEDISPEVLHASLATVSQEIQLFSGSIRDNLTMWNNNVLESDMIQAAKDACIHDVVVQKKGAYDYKLTEDGGNFSGGQRQRLEIARALSGNPSILILDEATSALDPITEKQIIDNIKRRGCSSVVIAHRLSAIRDCDQIIVLKHGRVVQHGTHEELISVNGPYLDLIKSM